MVVEAQYFLVNGTGLQDPLGLGDTIGEIWCSGQDLALDVICYQICQKWGQGLWGQAQCRECTLKWVAAILEISARWD